MGSPFIALKGFAPDLDPTDSGILTDCFMTLPSIRGMRAAPTPKSPGLPALSDTATGAATVVLLNGTSRAFAGMATAIYEAVGTHWENVTRQAAAETDTRAAGNPLDALMQDTQDAQPQAAGDPIPYRGTHDNVWRFAQMGNATLAVNGADPIQQSITAGPFEDIPGSPIAELIDVTQGFVFVAFVTDPTYGERPDGWWCSALYNQMDWKPDIATQCATGRLIDTPGAITACRALGSNIVLYKGNSVIYGVYQGPPVIWAFTVVSNEVGADSQEAVISIGTAHLFLGNDNFYIFDGTRPQPIGDSVKEWFNANREPGASYRLRSMHDQKNSLAYWFFVGVNSPDGITIDQGLVFNYRSNKWGRVQYVVEATFEHIVGQLVWDDLGSFYDTWDDLPAIAYNSPFWVSATRVPSIIDNTHTVMTLTGIAQVARLTTGMYGDDEAYTDLQYVRLRCAQDPDSGFMSARHTITLGSARFSTVEAPYVDGKFDVDISARWHASEFILNGDFEMLGFIPTLVKDGEA